jgi:hypothetical protein
LSASRLEQIPCSDISFEMRTFSTGVIIAYLECPSQNDPVIRIIMVAESGYFL